MDKLSNWLAEKLMPIAEWAQSNKYLMSIQNGLLMGMPIAMVGAVACIISDFPMDAYQNFMLSVFGDIWLEWNWSVIYNATIGIISLTALIGTALELGKRNGVEEIPAASIALMCYFILFKLTDDGAIGLENFAARGLFLAMLISVITGEIYALCIKKNLVVKLPESVPSFVSKQFTAMIPAGICAILILLLRYGIQSTGFESAQNLIYTLLQAPLTNIGVSLPGTLIASILNSVFWFFGIHGTEVISSVFSPIWTSAQVDNLAIYASNAQAARPYIVTTDFTNMIIFLTGTGITLPLCLEMMFLCKSQRMRSVGRIAVIPGIFNVNEPVIFGLPIVMNPIMLMPFLIVPVVCVAIAYGAMYFGLVPYPTGVTVPWTLPAPFGGWLLCNSWTGGVLQLVILSVSGLIYLPFVKALDKAYLEEEGCQNEVSCNG